MITWTKEKRQIRKFDRVHSLTYSFILHLLSGQRVPDSGVSTRNSMMSKSDLVSALVKVMTLRKKQSQHVLARITTGCCQWRDVLSAAKTQANTHGSSGSEHDRQVQGEGRASWPVSSEAGRLAWVEGGEGSWGLRTWQGPRWEGLTSTLTAIWLREQVQTPCPLWACYSTFKLRGWVQWTLRSLKGLNSFIIY